MSKTQDSIELTEEGLKKVQQRMSELEKPFDPDNKQGWSQEDLAQGSGTSVSTVKRFLNRKPITRQRIIKLTAALGIDPEEVVDLKVWNRTTATSQSTRKSDIDWQEVCFAMLEPKRELASNLFTSGMGITFELDDIHVPLGLVERPQKAQRRDDSSPEEGSRVYREEKEKITPIDYDDFFQQVLANQQSPKRNGKRLNIIGEPGAGKTTQLLKIADWVLDETEDLPIWISLGVVGEKPLQEYLLKDWLRDAAGKLDAAPPQWVEQLEQHLKDGRVWLLLDGADEMQVADPLGKLAEFLRVPLLKNVRVVLTCRLNLWDAAGNALSEFDTYKMLDFSYGDGKNPDQVKQFIDKWFGNPSPALPYKEREQEASPRIGGTEGGQQLRKALDETGKKRIKDLARHPLRLALLCLTWQSGRGLPDTKAELYEMFVEALYVLKKGVFPTTSAQRKDLNAALGRLALKASDNGLKTILPHSLVYEELEKPSPELFELADKLGWLNQVGVDPENPLKPVYAFFHPTFQEYFAACAISDWGFFLPIDHIDKPVTDKDNPDKHKRYRVFEPHWKEVFLLWMGRRSEEVNDEQKETFIRKLVDFYDGIEYQFYGYQAYFISAVAMTEFRNCTRAKEIIKQIVTWGFGDCLIPVVENLKIILTETERSKTIVALIDLIKTYLDQDIPWQSENSLWLAVDILEEVAKGDLTAIIAVVELIQEFRTQYIFRMSKATACIDTIDRSDRTEVTALYKLISELQANYGFRLYVLVGILGKIGKYNRNSIFILATLTEKCFPDFVRHTAAQNLGKIDPNNPLAVKTLVKLIHNYKSEDICKQAIRSLRELAKGNSVAIAELAELTKNCQNKDIYAEAANTLGQIGKGNSVAVRTLIELIETSQDEDTRLTALSNLERIGQGSTMAISTLVKLIQDSQDESTRRIVASRLGQMDQGNPTALFTLAELAQNSESESMRLRAVLNLDELDRGNPVAISTLAKLAQNSQDEHTRLLAASSLCKIAQGAPTAISSLVELIQNSQDELILWQAAHNLENLVQDNPTITSALIQLIQSSKSEFVRLRAASSLSKIEQDKSIAISTFVQLACNSQSESIRLLAACSLENIDKGNSVTLLTLVETLQNSEDEEVLRKATSNLKKIVREAQIPEVIKALKEYLSEQTYTNSYKRFYYCYKILYYCAQNMSYPDFYKAWYSQPTTTHPEAPDNIPVGNSTEAQTLEAQNLDFHRLQPTEHTYPLAINLLSLKEETEEGAIAQKLCTKIYKHQAVKIPGKPPTVKSDAELQQHLFEIQEKLQRPNLALVLYIKDANGFHEPTEEAIAFCQKLADPDLGIHIAWITNQPLEQPLKDIQPDPPKLISKIQSWIDEIV